MLMFVESAVNVVQFMSLLTVSIDSCLYAYIYISKHPDGDSSNKKEVNRGTKLSHKVQLFSDHVCI